MPKRTFRESRAHYLAKGKPFVTWNRTSFFKSFGGGTSDIQNQPFEFNPNAAIQVNSWKNIFQGNPDAPVPYQVPAVLPLTTYSPQEFDGCAFVDLFFETNASISSDPNVYDLDRVLNAEMWQYQVWKPQYYTKVLRLIKAYWYFGTLEAFPDSVPVQYITNATNSQEIVSSGNLDRVEFYVWADPRNENASWGINVDDPSNQIRFAGAIKKGIFKRVTLSPGKPVTITCKSNFNGQMRPLCLSDWNESATPGGKAGYGYPCDNIFRAMFFPGLGNPNPNSLLNVRGDSSLNGPGAIFWAPICPVMYAHLVNANGSAGTVNNGAMRLAVEYETLTKVTWRCYNRLPKIQTWGAPTVGSIPTSSASPPTLYVFCF